MKVGVTLLMALFLAALAPSVSFAGAPDTDGDGVADDVDTCPLTFNPAQTGTDTDSDGVLDICDNCVFVSNSNQCDSNRDGFGNVCDQDLTNGPSTGLINAADISNMAGTGFGQNFGATGGPCTVDQDFDDGLAADLVNANDISNMMGTGFSQNFGARLDGGVGGSCPGGATCRSGRTCATLPSVPLSCIPEVGPFTP